MVAIVKKLPWPCARCGGHGVARGRFCTFVGADPELTRQSTFLLAAPSFQRTIKREPPFSVYLRQFDKKSTIDYFKHPKLTYEGPNKYGFFFFKADSHVWQKSNNLEK